MSYISEADEWAYDQYLQCLESSEKTKDEIPKQLIKFIRTRDIRNKKLFPSQGDEMIKNFIRLIDGKVVTFGGRSSCGGKPDPTWISFRYWNEIVRKAKEFGYNIEIKPKKIKNRYASNNGGFWDENEYSIIPE